MRIYWNKDIHSSIHPGSSFLSIKYRYHLREVLQIEEPSKFTNILPPSSYLSAHIRIWPWYNSPKRYMRRFQPRFFLDTVCPGRNVGNASSVSPLTALILERLRPHRRVWWCSLTSYSVRLLRTSHSSLSAISRSPGSPYRYAARSKWAIPYTWTTRGRRSLLKPSCSPVSPRGGRRITRDKRVALTWHQTACSTSVISGLCLAPNVNSSMHWVIFL